jgi:glycosyltransferase involved in cell wall biosynthesis
MHATPAGDTLPRRLAAQRILFVEASGGGVVGGSLTGILHLIARLDRRRFAPVLALFEAKDVTLDGVPVHVLPPLPRQRGVGPRGRAARAFVRARDLLTIVVPRARAVGEVIRRERPALVYCANGLTANLDVVVAAARAGLPVICHEKGFRRVGPAERLMSRWVDACVCMTDEIAAHYRARRVHARRFLTVFDGIDTTQFAPGGGPEVRREFGIPEDAPLVGVVGHIQGWKGQLLAVEGVARARVRHPALRCLLVGGVHREGEEYAARLRERIAAPDLAGHVIFAGARRDVAACMDAMDVVLHTSVTPEPFGRVLIEAMALGRPLIAPREGGPLVIVADGETGLLVEPRDPAALGAAIDALLDDPARRAAMGHAARARVDAVFDIRHHVRAMEELFAELISAGASA